MALFVSCCGTVERMGAPHAADPGPPAADREGATGARRATWLRATDEFVPSDDREVETDQSLTLPERAAQSSVGRTLGTAMVGMAEAMYGIDQRPAIVSEVGSGQPEDDRSSSTSTVSIRSARSWWSIGIRRQPSPNTGGSRRAWLTDAGLARAVMWRPSR